MTQHNNTILILGFIGFIGVLIIGFGVCSKAQAADASIYISPEQANKDTGDVFDIFVKINPDKQKVCVVEGKLNLSKLSCEKITMGSNISAQTSPSCDNLNFTLGIQGCTTNVKTLFTIKVKAKSAGSATANLTGVDVIGEGVPVSFVASNGAYTIKTSCDCGSWKNKTCGGGSCSSEQRLQTRTCTPAKCASESRCIADSSCVSAPLPQNPLAEDKDKDKDKTKPAAVVKDAVKDENKDEKQTEGQQATRVVCIEREAVQTSLLASLALVWGGTSQLAIIIAIGILSLIGLGFIGIKEWKLVLARKKKQIL